jgi:hypothetical protein
MPCCGIISPAFHGGGFHPGFHAGGFHRGGLHAGGFHPAFHGHPFHAGALHGGHFPHGGHLHAGAHGDHLHHGDHMHHGAFHGDHLHHGFGDTVSARGAYTVEPGPPPLGGPSFLDPAATGGARRGNGGVLSETAFQRNRRPEAHLLLA